MKCGATDEEGVFVNKIGDMVLSAESDLDADKLFWDQVTVTGGT